MKKLTKEQQVAVNLHLYEVFYKGVRAGKDWITQGKSDEFPEELFFTLGFSPKEESHNES